jgi:hypothetical protein
MEVILLLCSQRQQYLQVGAIIKLVVAREFSSLMKRPRTYVYIDFFRCRVFQKHRPGYIYKGRIERREKEMKKERTFKK